VAAKALPVQVFKKKLRIERQQRMADANRPHPIAHGTSDATTMIILTPDQRAALTGLLVNAIMDTGSNRVAALYRGILTSLSEGANKAGAVQPVQDRSGQGRSGPPGSKCCVSRR